MLGPRPVIASLSLGATRTFRLHCMAAQAPQSHAARQQQHHDQAVTPSQSQHTELSASLKASLGSSAQSISQVNQSIQQFQQQQVKRVSSSAAIGNGASAQPAVQPGGVCATAHSKRVATVQQPQQAGCVSSIDVVLPHNTLVIMWPPMQEAWKHEVPGPVYQSVLDAVHFLMLLQCSSLSHQHRQCVNRRRTVLQLACPHIPELPSILC